MLGQRMSNAPILNANTEIKAIFHVTDSYRKTGYQLAAEGIFRRCWESGGGSAILLISVPPVQEGNIPLAVTSVQVNGVQGQPQPKSCFWINEMCIFHVFSWEEEAYPKSDGRCCWAISIFQLCNLRNLFNPNHPPSSIHWPWRSASGFGFIFKAVFNFFEVSCWQIFGLTCDSRRDLQISFSHFQSFKGVHHTKNLDSAFNRGNTGQRYMKRKPGGTEMLWQIC